MKHLEYEEVIRAKEIVENIDWGTSEEELLQKLFDLDLACRCVVAAGSFYKDIRWGTISFSMPATRKVLEYDVSNLDGDVYKEGAEYRITSSQINATDIGFYSEEVEKHVHTCRFRKK